MQSQQVAQLHGQRWSIPCWHSGHEHKPWRPYWWAWWLDVFSLKVDGYEQNALKDLSLGSSMRGGFLYAYHSRSWKGKKSVDWPCHFWCHFHSCENSGVLIWQSKISLGLCPALGDDWKQLTPSDWWAGTKDDGKIMELNCEKSNNRVCVRVAHQSGADEQRRSVLLAKNIGGREYHAKKCQNSHCITMVPNAKMCHIIHQPYILEWQVSALQQKSIGQMTNHAEKCHCSKQNKRWYNVWRKYDWPEVPWWDALQTMNWNSNTVGEDVTSRRTKLVVWRKRC